MLECNAKYLVCAPGLTKCTAKSSLHFYLNFRSLNVPLNLYSLYSVVSNVFLAEVLNLLNISDHFNLSVLSRILHNTLIEALCFQQSCSVLNCLRFPCPLSIIIH